MVEAAAASQAWAEENQPAAQASSRSYEGAGEVLLDLGDYKRGSSVLDDDFVLDIDLDEIPEPSPAEPAFSVATFRGRESYRTLPRIQPSFASDYASPATISSEPAATTDPMAKTLGYERVVDDEVGAPAAQAVADQNASLHPSVVSAPASAQELSPEMIDAIARRAVEQLSEKVIQEIAWEVVPQLAELLIKRQLEEKNS